MARILVIDDNQLVRDTLKAVLLSVGHKIAFAADGEEGLRAYHEFCPAVVMTDILMPKKEGIETIKDLRKISASVPIIAMSGGGRVGNLEYLEMALRFGANRTISKPFELEEVIEIVAGLLEEAVLPSTALEPGSQSC